MNSKPLKNYANEVPDEIKMMFKGLSNDERLGIVIALLKEGKITFGQMKKKFGLNSSSLTNHLAALQDGNLIKNFYEKKQGRIYSFYDVTDIPELLFDTTFDILLKSESSMKIVSKKVDAKHDVSKLHLKLHEENAPQFNLENEILKLASKVSFNKYKNTQEPIHSSSE